MLYLDLLHNPILHYDKSTGLSWIRQQDGRSWGWVLIGRCPTGRVVVQGFNGMHLGIQLIYGRICEVIYKRGDPIEDMVLWGHHRGSDDLVTEFHCMGDFL